LLLPGHLQNTFRPPFAGRMQILRTPMLLHRVLRFLDFAISSSFAGPSSTLSKVK
jgi:hypothetical protein